MDVVPISLVGVVQKGGGSAEVLETVGGDGPTRNIQEMFDREDEMKVEGLVAAEDNGKAPIFSQPAKFPGKFGKG
jgi:hypothetical protein